MVIKQEHPCEDIIKIETVQEEHIINADEQTHVVLMILEGDNYKKLCNDFPGVDFCIEIVNLSKLTPDDIKELNENTISTVKLDSDPESIETGPLSSRYSVPFSWAYKLRTSDWEYSY
jgi:hypothetical protein